MNNTFLSFIIFTMSIIMFFMGVGVAIGIERNQTIQRICSFTQPTLDDYTYCNQKSYDEVMFLLYRRLRNDK